MTPEEKAKDLIEVYRDKILMQHSAWNVMTENAFPMPLKFAQKIAIQLAIMCVEQILNEVSPTVIKVGRNGYNNLNYWRSVLEHIKSS